jgi:hypothetical protein
MKKIVRDEHIKERLIRCPKVYQDYLARLGGKNRYGDPNFRIIWGQHETQRAGGIWEVEGYPSFKGYRDLTIGGGQPCWILQMWHPPEEYGTPEYYYIQNEDENGYQTLGEYPYKGRYEILQRLVYTAMENGKFVIEPLTLSFHLLDILVGVAKEAKRMSKEKQIAVMKAASEAEEADLVRRIEDAMLNARMAFQGPVEAYGTVNRTSLLDRKMEHIQRHMNEAMRNARKMGRSNFAKVL